MPTATDSQAPPRAISVAEIWRYPVKSMAGETLERAELTLEGIPGDRVLYVIDRHGEILSSRTKPGLLGHKATVGADGEVLVDGLPWQSDEVAAAVEAAAGPRSRLVRAGGPERFDVMPLLVATDGAIEAFGYDRRRLRPNLILAGVPGLEERTWPERQIAIGGAVVVFARLRSRCIMTTWDPDTGEQDVEVLRSINARFDGTLALDSWAGQPGMVAVSDPARLLDERVEVEFPQLGRYA